MNKIIRYPILLIILLRVMAIVPANAQETTDYAKTIGMADSYFQKGDYINAKASYDYAIQINPTEQYPKDRLQETMDRIKDQMERSSQYASRVIMADDFYGKKDYLTALRYYKEALTYLPDDLYAREKLNEINQMLDQSRLNEEKYSSSMAEGDRYFNSGDYEMALDQYTLASELMPGEAAPSKKIMETRGLIEEKKTMEDDFSRSLQAAGNFMTREKYEEAIIEYESALTIRPGDDAAEKGLVNARKLKQDADSYALIIQDADNFYIEKKFGPARDMYQQATALRPADDYPQRMIEKVNIAMQDISQASQSDYEIAIARADRYYNEKDYDKAIAEYNNALIFKPDGEYARKRIEDINNTLRLRQMTEEAYQQSISRADNLFREKNYEESLYEYKNSLSYRPLEKYPKVKIDEIEAILTELKTQRDMYNSIVQGADKLFFADDYADSRIQYRKAEALFPEERYPKDQITMINMILGERDVNIKVVTDADRLFEVKQPSPEELALRDFQLKMDFGDELFMEGRFEEALVAYQEALAILPDDPGPQEKIAATEAKLEDMAALAEEEARLEAIRLQEQQAAAEQRMLIDKQYEDALTKADGLYAAGDLAGALDAYGEAMKLRPEESYAPQQIAEVNLLLGEKAVKDSIDRKYSQTISMADALFEAQEYAKAIQAYDEALDIKPGEKHPQWYKTTAREKLDEIADTEKKAMEDRIMDEQYASTIKSADDLFSKADYSNAILAYEQAIALKPNEQYPSQKITEAKLALADLAALAKLDSDYAQALDQANQFFADKKYAEAKAAYVQALGLKPGESLPQQKIAEIGAILEAIAIAEKKAIEERMLAEQKAQGEKKLLEEQQRLDQQYTSAVKSADELFAAGDYDNAMAAYQAALELKSQELYPRQKVSEIIRIKEEIARQQEIDGKYQAAITFADKHLAEGNYDQAIYEYKNANGLKPQETYPVEKMAEIGEIRAEIEREKALEAKYNDAIVRADELYKNENYEQALAALDEALALKPGDAFATAKITEVTDKIKTLEAQRESMYAQALLKADGHFAAGDYDMARLEYERASSLKPEEVYPLDQLKQVNEQLMRQRQFIQEAYDKSVADADKFYAGKIYDDAINAYRTAMELKPAEEYPREMVKRILKLISERAIVQINKDPVLIEDNTTHKFDFLPIAVKDRKSNYIFFKAVSKTPESYKLIVSFGKDQIKNGGMVLRIPKGADLNDFIVRISAQYKWFSDDNNWITFYPEGGDIEVSLVQISYSD